MPYKDPEARLAYQRAYHREHGSRPEVKARKAKYQREYLSRPGMKALRAEYYRTPEAKARGAAHSARPETKARVAEYNARSGTKERRARYNAEYNARPGAKERRAEYMSEYGARPEVRERVAEYIALPEVIARRNARQKERLAFDPQFILATRLRGRLYCAIKNKSKRGSAVELLGCTIDELITRFETLFVDGMSWANHGDWHIDHIRPLSSFDLEDPQQLAVACHFTNLQPLWAFDNISKGGRY